MGVFNRATWRMPDCGIRGNELVFRGSQRRPRKRMCRCTCRFLTVPAAQEHHSQETAGLDLSPVTVLRCQGTPPATPQDLAHPPRAGSCGRGPAASACASTDPDPGLGAPAAEGPAAPPGTVRAPAAPATAGPPSPVLTPVSRPADPPPRAITMPGIAAAGHIGGGQPTGPGRAHPDAGQQDPGRTPHRGPQPCHDPQPPRAAAGPLRHPTAACTPTGT